MNNEIKEGSIVRLNSDIQAVIRMTVGKILANEATVFWSFAHEIKTATIPLVSLTCIG